ncbi:MFS transporter [Galbitalea sp. SE-J8]|uniref:MFS transporter n=1 Tax=Galbitalea sp. SE-J8 TaxID=3054952 RepID=UPI00259CA475|nr:MFS transporter [Galbitalea sp. SE-J8]MDM4762779.1 MFS transporter [Galbitalea sp. SE-J8]
MSNSVGFRSERGPVLIAIMVSTGLVAIDATVVATAVQSIVADVGGFALFPWLFSVYLLAQAVTVPVYAKLADTIGRKPIMLIGIGLFLAGSILCGVAWSMPALIVFRAVQGLGAGAVQPMSITIMGDIYSVAERAKAQGYVASVWAASSVIGPTLGGLFSQFVSWRWIFFVNVPLCVVAVLLIARSFHERLEPRRHRIDVAGAVLLTLALTALVLGVLEGGVGWAWDSAPSIAAFALGAALLVGFVLAERRAAEPVLPLWVLSRRLLLTTALLSLGVGVALIGLTSYVPAYLETTLGAPPLAAGFALAFLTLGWPIAASLSGRLVYLRWGFRTAAILGTSIAFVGGAVLAGIAGTPNIVGVGAACFVVGLGMGLVATPSLIAAQSSVPWNERGVVTGANMFARSVGSAVGVAIFGAVANGVLAAHGADESSPGGMVAAGGAVFLGVAIVALGCVVASVVMPRTDLHRPAEPAAVDAVTPER